jgi:hypothetical protein
MIILDATNKSIEAVLAAAITTTQLPITSSYTDITSSAFTPGESDTATNSTTGVTAVAAPAASTQRQIKSISVYNADTVAATVTIRYNNNSTLRTIVKVTLSVGDTLSFLDGIGWSVINTSGQIKGIGAMGYSAGYSFKFSTSTANTDPGLGNVAIDNASLGAAGNLIFNTVNSDSQNVANILDLLDNPTSAIRSTVFIYDPANPANFAFYDITGGVTTSTAGGSTAKSFPVTAEASGGSFSSGLALRVLFMLTGDKGDTGLTGNTGSTGPAGPSSLAQNSKSAAYTTVLSDAGKHIFHPSADVTARTFTIDSNANVAYALGDTITFVNQNGAGVVTIAITSDTMRLAGPGTTGSRTLAANGIATAIKVATTEWLISGTGLT